MVDVEALKRALQIQDDEEESRHFNARYEYDLMLMKILSSHTKIILTEYERMLLGL